MKRAIFLDRDGVIDELVLYADTGAWEAPRRVSDLHVLPGVSDALRRAAGAGWLLFIVSNQPDYAKGKTSLEDLRAVHARILVTLGVDITESYLCFHHPQAVVEDYRRICECRKPGTLSLRTAARDYDVDLSESWLIGDSDTDLVCGKSAGCRVALVEYPHSANRRGAIEPDVRGRTLEECIEQIL